MSETFDHRDDWGDDLAAFALDALDEREAQLVARHVAECDACAERLRWLAPAVDVLPATVAQQDPPPELRSRLMEIVEGEAAAEAPAAAPAPRRSWAERLGLSGASLRPALAGMAAFLVIAAGVTGYVLRDGSDAEPASPSESYAAVGTGPKSLAHGTLEVNGDEGSLRVANLPATRRGEVYQAWVQDSVEHGGAVHPSSVFVVSDDGSGNVMIPHGLENAERVMVTREPVGGSEKPHESSLVTAELE